MSRTLAEILGVNQTLFADDISRLEHASGHTSADVKLTADILSLVRHKTKELGLDPRDTTGRELYYGLLNLARLHDTFLAQKLGVDNAGNVAVLLPRIREAVLTSRVAKTVWVLKPAVAKRLLKAHPPHKLMRYLGYKSLDSMLKREPVGELMGGVRLIEAETWYRKFIAQYDQLSSMDFEVRSVDVRLLDKAKWQKAALEFVKSGRHNILTVKELGVILILPLPFDKRPGVTITLLPLLLHHINEVRLYSSFYKLHQVQPDFGERLVASLLYDRGIHLRVGGQDMHWRVAHRHFGGNSKMHPEFFEPHVTADDLAWRRTEDVMYRLEPALHFWYGTDFVAAFEDGRPISFNLLDMALNYLNEVPYEQRLFGHAQDGLWNELFVRYMGLPALENQVFKQLDYEAVESDMTAFKGEEV